MVSGSPLVSNRPMNMSATMRPSGDPITNLSLCWYGLLSNKKCILGAHINSSSSSLLTGVPISICNELACQVNCRYQRHIGKERSHTQRNHSTSPGWWLASWPTFNPLVQHTSPTKTDQCTLGIDHRFCHHTPN